MKDFCTLGAILLLIFVMLVVGALNTVDQIRERNHYCQMVHDGAWPDYKHTYTRDCELPGVTP